MLNLREFPPVILCKVEPIVLKFEVATKQGHFSKKSNACQHCVVLLPSYLSGFSRSGHDLDSCILIC